MRQQVLGDADVVVDYLRLRKFLSRVKNFIDVRNVDASAPDG